MEQRYATSPEHIRGMDTTELRRRFLVQDLFADDEVTLSIPTTTASCSSASRPP